MKKIIIIAVTCIFTLNACVSAPIAAGMYGAAKGDQVAGTKGMVAGAVVGVAAGSALEYVAKKGDEKINAATGRDKPKKKTANKK